eukprot:1126354-Pelagomonas_calceolata.AAC.8
MSTVALENGPREPSDKSVYTTSRTYPLVQDKRYTKVRARTLLFRYALIPFPNCCLHATYDGICNGA